MPEDGLGCVRIGYPCGDPSSLSLSLSLPRFHMTAGHDFRPVPCFFVSSGGIYPAPTSSPEILQPERVPG